MIDITLWSIILAGVSVVLFLILTLSKAAWWSYVLSVLSYIPSIWFWWVTEQYGFIMSAVIYVPFFIYTAVVKRKELLDSRPTRVVIYADETHILRWYTRTLDGKRFKMCMYCKADGWLNPKELLDPCAKDRKPDE